jgi:SAM-dependent methyltransferase
MWTRSELLALFAKDAIQPAYIEFGVPDSISLSKAIQNREVATTKSLNETSLSDVAGLEGSPSFDVIDSMWTSISSSSVMPELSGIGLELGSGIGLLSAAVISADVRRSIVGIIAVEAGAPFVRDGIRRASKEVLQQDSDKILPCQGTFENLEIESESVDFILQIEALHHAEMLEPALREAHRVLKKGGHLISIDRSWPNPVKSEVLEELLDHEYEKEWLIKKGFPHEEKFTRRDNGEHEYRDFEWNAAFNSAGFSVIEMKFIHPQPEKFHILKRLICLVGIHNFVGIKIPARTGLIRSLVQQITKLKISGAMTITRHPRPLTVITAKKEFNTIS